MGSSQSVEKKTGGTSPSKSPSKHSPGKDANTIASPFKEEPQSEVVQVVPDSTTTPPRPAGSDGDKQTTSPTAPATVEVSEEVLAIVESAAKNLKDTTGGKSLEIVLSPAIKKPKSRVSPPTSPTSNQETLAKKLQEAEDRKKSLDLEKKQKISANLEKVNMAKDKREFEQEKASAQKKKEIESKLCKAEEKREKYLDDVKEKVSEHTAKIEKAQQALEAAIEAAKEAAKEAVEKKMTKTEENKNMQMEEMLSALKDHSDHVKSVRSNMEKIVPKAQQILENIAKKEESAKELKAKQEAERRLKLDEQKRKVELVKLNKEKIAAELSTTTESA